MGESGSWATLLPVALPARAADRRRRALDALDRIVGAVVRFGDHVVVEHVASFSKSHGPDLRLAAIGGPGRVISAVADRRPAPSVLDSRGSGARDRPHPRGWRRISERIFE